MIGHHLERIQNQRFEPRGQRMPSPLYQAARLVRYHFTLDDFAEQALVALGAYSDEIRATPA
jgi:hypothetical protein